VLPIDVEEVRNTTPEGTPQDCELTASKRLMARLRREHPQMAQVVIGDDLYSHAPFGFCRKFSFEAHSFMILHRQ